MRHVLAAAIASTALAALLMSACAIRHVHPGHTLVRRKCTSCHSEPPREQLRKYDVRTLMKGHAEDRIVLTDEQVRDLESYVESGDP